jgi:5'-3' exonuclease
MSTLVGIDGDLIVYSCGFAADDEPLAHCLSTVKKMIHKIIDKTEATDYKLFLTGKGNFREEVATIAKYKGNREDNPKPFHYDAIRKYMVDKHGAIVIEGMEADDALGIEASLVEEETTYVLASYDKDLDMIPCYHYVWESKGSRPRAEKFYSITPVEGLRLFYTQMLTGDSTDNIAGLFKLTGTKATKKFKQPLEEMNEEIDMWNHVRSVYRSAYLNRGILPDLVDVTIDKWLLEIGRLLWIRRTENEELWTPPEPTFKDLETIDDTPDIAQS